jgi:hypothetical protein
LWRAGDQWFRSPPSSSFVAVGYCSVGVKAVSTQPKMLVSPLPLQRHNGPCPDLPLAQPGREWTRRGPFEKGTLDSLSRLGNHVTLDEPGHRHGRQRLAAEAGPRTV